MMNLPGMMIPFNSFLKPMNLFGMGMCEEIEIRASHEQEAVS
jgi:hypothetical protein